MLVSVLINNYNYGQYLEECIDSLLNQTYKNIEIIVYDDGSTDNSLQVLSKYKDQLTIISNPNYGRSPNQNQANAIYQAFLKSKGDIICFLDSDDAFNKEKVSKVVNFLELNKEVNVVQNKLIEMNREGKISNILRPVLKKVIDYKEYILSSNDLFHLFVPTSGLSLKREIMKEVLPLKEDKYAHIWADTRIMLSTVFIGNIGVIDEPLTNYRIHGENDSGKRNTIEGHKQYTKELYEYFNGLARTFSFDEISFRQENFLEHTYFYNSIDKEKTADFLQQCTDATQVFIWGAGESGQAILHYLKKEFVQIEGFIDASLEKQHHILMDKKILLPQQINLSDNMMLLISPYFAYEEISNYLISYGLLEGVNFISPYKK